MRRLPKISRLFSALLVLFVATSIARSADLGRYIGKHPTEKINGKSLYEVDDVRRSIIALAGGERFERILSHERTGPIREFADSELGETILIGQGMYQDPSDESLVILKKNGTAIGVCLTIVGREGGAQWFGAGWTKQISAESPCRSSGGEDSAAEIAQFKTARSAPNR